MQVQTDSLGSNHDNHSGGKLCTESSSWCNFRELDSHSPHGVVTVSGKSRNQSETAEHHHPDLGLDVLRQNAVLVHLKDDRHGPSRVSDLSSTVREDDADGREDLESGERGIRPNLPKARSKLKQTSQQSVRI